MDGQFTSNYLFFPSCYHNGWFRALGASYWYRFHSLLISSRDCICNDVLPDATKIKIKKFKRQQQQARGTHLIIIFRASQSSSMYGTKYLHDGRGLANFSFT